MKHRHPTKSFATSHTADELQKANIKQIAELEALTKQKCTFSDRVADSISAFCGSTSFVYVHLIWFIAWIFLNSPYIPEGDRFDPFPYQFLTLVVSLEAIFLSTFILISQNRQARISDRRNQLDLQINLLSEQEGSKMLNMLAAIHEKLGILAEDPELSALESRTDLAHLVDEIEEGMNNCSPK